VEKSSTNELDDQRCRISLFIVKYAMTPSDCT